VSGRSTGGLLLAFGLVLGGCTRPLTAPSRSNAAPTPVASATGTTASVKPGRSYPIGISANRVGSRYVFLTRQDGRRKVYTLRADSETGRYFGQDTGRSTFTNPHVTFFGHGGNRLVADAPTGTVVEKDKTVRMSGGVHARSGDGLTLRSDTLAYDDQTDKVHGAGHVTVTSPRGEELQGETLDWNLRDGAIVVSGAH